MFNNYQPDHLIGNSSYGSSANLPPAAGQDQSHQRLPFVPQQHWYPGYYHYNAAPGYYNSSMESSPSSASSSSSVLDQYTCGANRQHQHVQQQNQAWSDLNIKHERLEYASPVPAHHSDQNSEQDLQDLAAASSDLYHSPGIDFDPSSTNFTVDELRPQPIIKKRQKKFVPDHMKDESYWDRRRKNNEAARMSREAKRRKENQIMLRAAYLEEENSSLRTDVDKVLAKNQLIRNDVQTLSVKLGHYQQQQQGKSNPN